VSACADLNSRDAVRELTEAMAKVSDAHLSISQMLDSHKASIEVRYWLTIVTIALPSNEGSFLKTEDRNLIFGCILSCRRIFINLVTYQTFISTSNSFEVWYLRDFISVTFIYLPQQEEVQKSEEFRVMVGEDKSPNNIFNELRVEGEKCLSALTSANDSNMALHAAAVQHKPALSALSQPLQHVTANLPSVHQAMAQAGQYHSFTCP